MKQMSSYPVRISRSADIRKTLSATAGIYRKAVDFFISVCMEEWETVSACKGQTGKVNAVEAFTIKTSKRKTVPYDFGKDFYKFPSYLRRAAIAQAVGKVSSYKSNLKGWEASDPRTRGRIPGYPSAGYAYPAMYRDNMFIRTGTYTASIKVFTRNTWDWLEIGLRKGDADYITRHCRDRRECVPMDLGINSACTCCVMGPDGTVTGRRSLKLSGENDRLARAVGRIKRAQQHGARRMPRLWARAKGISSDIAVKTAEFIVKTAVRYKVDVIVMEHLDIRGRKRGSRKQRLHHWRAMYVQRMVAQKAHRGRIRVSTVCAWNTSRLAFDGSGRVKRGKESEKTADNYSICEFSTGKIYNCDLNASYNIGARYFIRELLKSLPETEEQRLEAKDPSVSRRSTCTLSTLINLSAALTAAAV